MHHDASGHVQHMYIEAEALKPQSHFTPEDKMEIAAIHADHIAQYAHSGLNLTQTIILNAGLHAIHNTGTALTKTSAFKTERGHTIQVQTTFTPFESILTHASENMRIIRLRNGTYQL